MLNTAQLTKPCHEIVIYGCQIVAAMRVAAAMRVECNGSEASFRFSFCPGF